MPVDSIGANNAAALLQQAQRAETLEPRKAGPDHDGDRDDLGSASAPKPVPNTSGQMTGLMVNTEA